MIPPEIREALRDACVQRTLDIHMACGCSTDELEKAERLSARYDAALAWLDQQPTSAPETPCLG